MTEGFNATSLANFDFSTQTVRRGRIIQPPFDNMTPQTFSLILASIPPFWRTICPISLSSSADLDAQNPLNANTRNPICPNMHCALSKVCPVFNDPSGARPCRYNPCRYVHLVKTCEREAEGGECRYGENRKGYFPPGGRKGHFEKRVHRGQCTEEEWRIRCVLVGLRGLHARGGYMG
jgi:hypothetical protein